MGSRTITAVVTPNTIALNAFIFGYAGHSLVTPHAPLQQIWWTDERIRAKVTKDFIISKLRTEERKQLEKTPAFGHGLTDDTYLDWILERAKRLFLILAEIGVPDQIFGVIDDTWDDDDLPIPRDTVERLALSYKRDEALERKFYNTQFTYLLRELHQGTHIDYAPNEVIPLDYVHKLPPAVSLQIWSRVHLPNQPAEAMVRRRVSLEDAERDGPAKAAFLADIESAQYISHPHIAPVWASYTVKDSGYWITPFVGEHTLKTFIDHRSAPQYIRLSKPERHRLLLRWMHCLADALATLHSSGYNHTAIRPSNILIDASNSVAFSDIGSLKTFQRDKRVDETEAYNYDAPELHVQSPTSAAEDEPQSLPRKHSRSPSLTWKRRSFSHRKSMGSRSSSDRSSQSSASLPRAETLPRSFVFSLSSVRGSVKGKGPAATEPDTPDAAAPDHNRKAAREKSDIFSLGCVYLDILTFLLKRKASDFLKHRSTKVDASTAAASSSPLSPPTSAFSSALPSPGRAKNSRVDASFHANLAKVQSWMDALEAAATNTGHGHVHGHRGDDDAALFRAVLPILRLLRAMLSQNPNLRPAAPDVRDRLFDTLVSFSGVGCLHCAARGAADEFAEEPGEPGGRGAAARASAQMPRRAPAVEPKGKAKAGGYAPHRKSFWVF